MDTGGLLLVGIGCFFALSALFFTPSVPSYWLWLQVAERALFLWNNEHLVNVGCLSRQHANLVLPAIYPALYCPS